MKTKKSKTLQDPPNAEQTDPSWVELVDRKKEFQEIARLLVDYDERSGRFKRFNDPECHFMRKAISVADPNHLRVFLDHLGAFIYYVVVELNSKNGHVCTSWVHEDGIRVERDEFARQKTHPVHNFLCLTDLYERGSRPLPSNPEEIHTSLATLGLLADEVLLNVK